MSPPLVASTPMALAQSCGDPPPKEIRKSHPAACSFFSPSFTCRHRHQHPHHHHAERFRGLNLVRLVIASRRTTVY